MRSPQLPAPMLLMPPAKTWGIGVESFCTRHVYFEIHIGVFYLKFRMIRMPRTVTIEYGLRVGTNVTFDLCSLSPHAPQRCKCELCVRVGARMTPC